MSPEFQALKFRLHDSDRNLTAVYTLSELISKTYRRGKFEFRGRWTGLKDKNGKEIYEGDRLKFFDRVVCTIVWDFNGWAFEWTDPVYKNVRQQKYEPVFRNIHLYEVIGNIYENPELLK